MVFLKVIEIEYLIERPLARVARNAATLRRLQQKPGLTAGQIVLGYLTRQPFPAFTLVGPKTLADLQDCLNSVQTQLSPNVTSFYVP